MLDLLISLSDFLSFKQQMLMVKESEGIVDGGFQIEL